MKYFSRLKTILLPLTLLVCCHASSLLVWYTLHFHSPIVNKIRQFALPGDKLGARVDTNPSTIYIHSSSAGPQPKLGKPARHFSKMLQKRRTTSRWAELHEFY